MELSQELAVSPDPFKIADLVFFNLMGEMGTSKASLWIVSVESERRLIHLRRYGIRKQSVKLTGKLFESQKSWKLIESQKTWKLFVIKRNLFLPRIYRPWLMPRVST